MGGGRVGMRGPSQEVTGEEARRLGSANHRSNPRRAPGAGVAQVARARVYSAPLPHHWKVHVAREPLVHRNIPQPPVLFDGRRVPPLPVETPVSEAQQLAQDVQPAVEDAVEDAQPHVDAGDGELQNALEHAQPVKLLVGRGAGRGG